MNEQPITAMELLLIHELAKDAEIVDLTDEIEVDLENEEYDN